MNCWGAKGYTMVKPENLMALLHGRKDCYKTWSAFKNKALDFACNDLKRLYDMGIINQYPVYQPFYKSEEAEAHHSMPDHITIFFKDRQNMGDTTDGSKVSEELQASAWHSTCRESWKTGFRRKTTLSVNASRSIER